MAVRRLSAFAGSMNQATSTQDAGFFARQPHARMTEQEIEQDRNCHYDLQD